MQRLRYTGASNYFDLVVMPGDSSRRRSRSRSPRRDYHDYDRDRKPPRDFDRRPPREHDRREYPDLRERRETREIKSARSSPVTDIRPAGFPDDYHFQLGDWLCPSPGCEGYVNPGKVKNCMHCGRSQPHYIILTELAKNPRFRTDRCAFPDCAKRHCPNSHNDMYELRSYSKSRDYHRNPSDPPLVPPAPDSADIGAFCDRWHIRDPASGLLHRLPVPLCDLVLRSFLAPPDVPDDQLSTELLKTVADIIRPSSFTVSHSNQFYSLLNNLVKNWNYPTGIAVDESGVLGLTMEKDVAIVKIRDWSESELGLLAMSLSFNGLAVVHSPDDVEQLRFQMPKLYSDLLDRIRIVSNRNEMIYVPTDPVERVIDRATQAKIDAMQPRPLLTTPEQTPESTD
jgi:hypothetical protein